MERKVINVGGISVTLFGIDLENTIEEKRDTALEKGRSVVFATHGRQQKLESIYPVAETIVQACEGKLIVAAIEQRNHGNRLLDERLNANWDKNDTHPRDVYSLVLGTSFDIVYLLDMLPLFMGFQPIAFGIVGFSLGGHVSMIAASMDDRISGIVSIVGSCDYQQLIKIRALQNKKQVSPTNTLWSLTTKYDPVQHVDRFHNKSFCLISGSKDTVVPSECNFGFFDKIKSSEFYHVDRHQFHIIEGARHEVSPSMMKITADFFNKWAA